MACVRSSTVSHDTHRKANLDITQNCNRAIVTHAQCETGSLQQDIVTYSVV
jgi:hypothetical protein